VAGEREPHPVTATLSPMPSRMARAKRVTAEVCPGRQTRCCNGLYPVRVSVIAVVLLAAAVVLLAAAEWPRLSRRVGAEAWQSRRRARRKSQLRVIPGDADEPDESDEFARSVERDLASLPTFDPRDAKKR
jgi:hypothetical protein